MYSGFFLLSSNSIIYLQWALLSHSDIRDYLLRIHDYIRYILYSNPLDSSILIAVLTQFIYYAALVTKKKTQTFF